RALPACDAARPDTSGVCQSQSLAVMGVKGFYLDRDLFSLRQKRDAAVRHSPVHIHQKYLNLRRALLQRGRNFEVGQSCLRRTLRCLWSENLKPSHTAYRVTRKKSRPLTTARSPIVL